MELLTLCLVLVFLRTRRTKLKIEIDSLALPRGLAIAVASSLDVNNSRNWTGGGNWSGREDSNLRPPGPEPGALARLSHAPK